MLAFDELHGLGFSMYLGQRSSFRLAESLAPLKSRVQADSGPDTYADANAAQAVSQSPSTMV